ncbi:MAG: FHA domain-containing protein [Anaerolineae bacterium]|nr:FHA domain-containing protein [Anaerolineae bacterium]
MGMSLLDETFEVYVQMRRGGKDAKSVLDSLRMRFELLTPGERAEMVRRVKAWEAKHVNSPVANNRQKRATDAAKHGGHDTEPALEIPRPPSAAPEKMVACSRCGKLNGSSEVFWAHCGNFLRVDNTRHETTRLDESEMDALGPDFFGPNSTLVLLVASDGFSYSIQPQRYKHETVIGRSEGSTMKPDIDLSDHFAGEMGVSRLHVALQYNAKNNLLSVSDMKSANGTFINGQKLFPQEVRVLRDGDELRLGRLVLRVYFKHPTGYLRGEESEPET